MKKLGIVTFHRAHNYGATLQCMALQYIISKNKNIDVKVIDYLNKKIEHDYSLFRIDNTNIKTIIKSTISSFIFLRKNLARRKLYKKYITDHFRLTNICYSNKDVEDAIREYDYIITGSDQVWNKNLTNGIDDVYFLNIDTNAKKISYAASSGSTKLNENKYKELIEKIDCISVREQETYNMLKSILDKKIYKVLDPTLLLTKDEWINLIDLKDNVESEKFIFVYTPNAIKEFPLFANTLSKKMKLKMVNFKKYDVGYENVLKNMYVSTPDDFVNYIINSELVVSTSFHATVFAIIFHKEFITLVPKDNKGRLKTLLELLGLEERYITDMTEFDDIDFNKKIDYKKVDEKIKCLKQESLNFLFSAINVGDNNE